MEVYPFCLWHVCPQDLKLLFCSFSCRSSFSCETHGSLGPNPRWGCKHYFPHWRVEKQPENARAMDWIRFLMLTSADNSTTVIAVRGTLESCFGEVFGYVDVAMILG